MSSVASDKRRAGSDPIAVRLGRCACRLLLLCYPRWFRQRYAGAVLQNATDLLRSTQEAAGTIGAIRLFPSLIPDLVGGGLRERAGSRPHLPAVDRLPMLDSLLLDLRTARRSMARRPGLTALAVITLALGIGASASMFSVVDAVLLQPLPYPESERLMSMYLSIPEWTTHESFGAIADRARWSYEEFGDWRQRQTSFDAAALVGGASGNLTGLGEAERMRIGLAGLELFSMLGAVPSSGRFFDPQDEESEGRVAVVSSGFALERLGGQAEALGRTFELSGNLYTVIGVLPDGFQVSRTVFPVWIPIFGNRPGGYFPGNTGDMQHVFLAIGRLRPGLAPAMAAEETARLLAAINDDAHFTEHGAAVVPRLQDQTEEARGALLVLMGAVLLLLLVACANVATFLLGQAIDRQREIAIRGALGAGRRRISRQLLTESALLALVGGLAGLVVAALGVQALTALAPAGLPRIEAVDLDFRAVLFAMGLASLSGLVFGLAPALSLAGSDLVRALTAARLGSSGRSRLQAAMVIAEVSIATVLLVGAGLLTRSLLQLNDVEPGFEPDGVLTLTVSPASHEFTDGEGNFADGAMREYFDRLQQTLGALPGIEQVALAQVVPFSGYRANNNIEPEGYVAEEGELLIGERRLVGPGFFELLRVPLREGRTLRASDNRVDAASVVVVTESLAQRFWPGESAVGKTLGWWGQESLIVGVIGNVRDRNLVELPGMQFYAPLAPYGQAGGGLTLRTDGDPADHVTTVRAAVRQFDANLPITALVPMTSRISDSIASARYRTRLIGVFALVSALLSVLGLYGVTSRAVAARTRELGIRIALGAGAHSLVRLVLRDGLRLAAFGALLGVAVSLAGTRMLEGLLFGVASNDPATLVGIVVLVAGMALLASLVPSLRASRVEPTEALRAD